MGSADLHGFARSMASSRALHGQDQQAAMAELQPSSAFSSFWLVLWSFLDQATAGTRGAIQPSGFRWWRFWEARLASTATAVPRPWLDAMCKFDRFRLKLRSLHGSAATHFDVHDVGIFEFIIAWQIGRDSTNWASLFWGVRE